MAKKMETLDPALEAEIVRRADEAFAHPETLISLDDLIAEFEKDPEVKAGMDLLRSRRNA